MKKGCFVQIVIVGTILIAALVYIIKNKFDEWFLQPGKKLLITEVEENLDTDLNHVKNSKQKDSLKILVKYYVENLKSLNDVIVSDGKSFFNEFNSAIGDSLITIDELSQLTSIMKKDLYEKPKNN